MGGEHIQQAQTFVDKVNAIILFPLITLLTSIALLMFLWGAFEFVRGADSEDARNTGRRHMLYGIIGLLIMLSAYAIIKIAASTFGVDCVLDDPTCIQLN